MILLGRIVGAHGIKGEVLVHSFAEEPGNIGSYGPLSDKAGTRAFKLRVLRMTPKGAIVARITGIQDATSGMNPRVGLMIRDSMEATGRQAFVFLDKTGAPGFYLPVNGNHAGNASGCHIPVLA